MSWASQISLAGSSLHLQYTLCSHSEPALIRLGIQPVRVSYGQAGQPRCSVRQICQEPGQGLFGYMTGRGGTYKEYSGRVAALQGSSKTFSGGGGLLPQLVHHSLADHEARKDVLFLKGPCRIVQIHRLLDHPLNRNTETHKVGPLV